MSWWVAAALGVAAIIAFLRWRRRWVEPWAELEQLVRQIVKAQAPRTFLLDGNPCARRVGIALEGVFLRQRDLIGRATEGELNVRTILGAMQDGLAVVDGAGRIRLLNPALARMFDLAPESTGGTALETFRDDLVAKVIEQTVRDGARRSELINLRGGRRVALTSLPMPQQDSAGTGAVALFQDVTQLQQLEQVRRDFVANVSHELRTPLSIFRGYLETLLDDPDLPPAEQHRILRVLEKHSERLHSLVNDLLSLAQLESGSPQLLHLARVNLTEFLRRIARDWEKRAATKDLRLSLDLAPDLPLLEGDEARLEETIYNLLDNAVKYARNGSTVVVRARREGEDRVQISVADEGAGIAASDLPRIFERFYRADKARSRELGGTGLGLSIVKHIVELHHGSVSAESHLGRGTIVHVTLPSHVSETAKSAVSLSDPA